MTSKKNRNPRDLSQNKLGPYQPGIGFKKVDQDTLTYKANDLYNSLPPQLTTIKKHHIFKKKIKEYYMEIEIIIEAKDLKYNEEIDIPPILSYNLINICENLSNINIPPTITKPPGPHTMNGQEHSNK